MSGTPDAEAALTLADLAPCFDGVVPAVICTAAADGTPNITYLSRAHPVDAHRLATSNQFFSKTARNLAENPRASLLLVQPNTHDEYRLELVYERTERRGPVFERLRADVDQIAALTGMQDVFHLRAADIYRVVTITQLERSHPHVPESSPPPAPTVGGVAELCARLSRCGDLDALVGATVDGLAQVLGYRHAMLLLLDEGGGQLYTIASRGYAAQGIGSEVPLGEGVVGMAAVHGAPVRVGNLGQMQKYADRVRASYEDEGIRPGRSIPLPGLLGANSRLAVPAMSMGELVGVVVVEDTRSSLYGPDDEAALTAVASVLAASLEHVRASERTAAPRVAAPKGVPAPVLPAPRRTLVRHFSVDGSTFLDGDYLIKGVAGRILWTLLGQHEAEGRVEFTNRELRRDPALDLPDYRHNLESRLILLKRRLDERAAPVRIERTGRGRFRLEVEGSLDLQAVDPGR